MVWELSQNESLSPANCRDIHLFAKHSGAALERGEENIIAIFPKVGQHKYCHFLAQYVTMSLTDWLTNCVRVLKEKLLTFLAIENLQTLQSKWHWWTAFTILAMFCAWHEAAGGDFLQYNCQKFPTQNTICWAKIENKSENIEYIPDSGSLIFFNYISQPNLAKEKPFHLLGTCLPGKKKPT